VAGNSNRESMGAAVAPGMIARVTQAVRYVVAGVTPTDWFGPQQPMAPMAQEQAVGRRFDYDTGFNLRQTPKQNEGTDFGSLRGLADGYDLLRIVIETRKDQISALKFKFKPKDSTKDGSGDARIQMLHDFFAMPDKENSWPVWLRALIEDMLVIDAATIYPRMTNGGDLYSLDLMDGAIVKRVLDATGRTPMAPSPAYQVILKGMPAVDYTRETLIYSPRNIRTNRVYGFSPVEQVQMTVNIALRRQLSQLAYYTDGSTPDLIFGVPDTWQPDQIKQFQEWWDSVLAGNSNAKRGTRFVPGGLNPLNTKDQILKDLYDEWLARIVCFAFSVSAQALTAHMNRATAQTASDAAAEEGLYPLMQWVKDLIDRILAQCFKITDLEFAWNDDETVNALDQSTIDVAYVTAKIKDPNEVRATLGLPAFTPEQEAKMNPPPPPALAAFAGQGGGDPPPGGKKPGKPPVDGSDDGSSGSSNDGKAAFEGRYLGKARPVTFAKARVVPALKRDRPATKACEEGIASAIERWQKASKASLLAQALEQFKGRAELFHTLPTHAAAHKADATDVVGSDAEAKALLQQALDEITEQLETSAGLVTLYGDVSGLLEAMTSDGAVEALVQIGMDNAPDVTLDLVNEQAVQWAQERAAEMVGMKMVNGELVPNPNAQWVITSLQRDQTAALVVEALKSGWSNDELASSLGDLSGFGADRAMLIARTETAMADVQGNMTAYRASPSVAGKEWILGSEACDDCVENNEAGVLGLNDLFPSGDDAPPAHPNCRCDILPSLIEDDSTGENEDSQAEPDPPRDNAGANAEDGDEEAEAE
jgi:hypothetical protein